MKLSKSDKLLLKASIKHWREDILARFEAGDEIYICLTACRWKSDDSRIKMYAEHCPLCDKYYRLAPAPWGSSCPKCPMTKAGYQCSGLDSPWYKFWYNQTKENCLGMIEAMEGML